MLTDRARIKSNTAAKDQFYPMFLWKEALFIVALIAFQKLGQPANFVTAVVLIIMSLRSAKGAVQALALVTLLSYLSFYYFPVGFNSAAKWIVLLAASCMGIIHSQKSTSEGTMPDNKWLTPLLMFVAVTGISSAIAGADMELSLFKLFTFAAGALGAMYVFGTRSLDLRYITNWLYTVWLVILLLSIPLLKIGNGYMPRTGMFLGILGQSQAYAVFMVPFTLYLVVRWLIGLPMSLWHKLLTFAGCYTVYLSSSRTAVFSFLLALVSVAVIYLFRVQTGSATKNRLVPRVLMVAGAVVILNFLTMGSVTNVAGVFSHKYGEKADIMATRTGKVEFAQRTFEKHPVFGKGFGLAMDGEDFFVKRDPILGLPLSAPVEAGVIYTAAPAQLGMLGTLFLLYFLYIYMRPLITRGRAVFVALAAVCFFVNFGEYVFFSTGGVGMYHWLLYGLAYHAAVRYPEVVNVSKSASRPEIRKVAVV